MNDYRRLVPALHGEVSLPAHFEVENAGRLVHDLQKIVRKERGKNPSGRKARSFCLDADCYTLFEKDGTRYIKIMSLTRGKRIVIALAVHGPVIY